MIKLDKPNTSGILLGLAVGAWLGWWGLIIVGGIALFADFKFNQ